MAIYPELRGKSAIVTGASAGIGKTICLALAEQDINVLVNGKSNRQAATKVAAAAMEKGVKAIAELADVTRSADVERMVSAAVSVFGKVDIFINNAGGFPEWRLVVETPEGGFLGLINFGSGLVHDPSALHDYQLSGNEVAIGACQEEGGAGDVFRQFDSAEGAVANAGLAPLPDLVGHDLLTHG